MNEKNLIQNNDNYSLEEKKQLNRNAQIKSTESRNKRKPLKEELSRLLSGNNIQETMCLSIVGRALEGNVKAFEVIRDTIGERPKDISSLSLLNSNRTIIINDKNDSECIQHYLNNPDDYLSVEMYTGEQK